MNRRGPFLCLLFLAALGVSDYAYHDTFVRDMKGVPK